MTAVVVRIATGADIDALVDLRRAWTAEHLEHPDVDDVDDPTFDARFRSWFDRERPHRTFWLADVPEAAAVGMVNLLTFDRMPAPERDSGRWGYLGNMYVRPEHRDQDVGRQLLDALVAHGEANGLVRIVLSPTEQSIPFYRRAGFGPADELLLRPRSGTTAPPAIVSGT